MVPGAGWLIALGLFAAYALFLYWVASTGRMARWNLSIMLGVVLMVRTQRGKALLDFLAKPRRMWNFLADVGTVCTLLGMALMVLIFGATVYVSLQPHSGVPALGASEIFVIPGVNPFVPLWYGIIGLIVTLVVHEGAHGVLARANDLKVKSLGLLFAVIPVGAFVEPDEAELGATSRRNRLRVFSAGPSVNVALAVICLLIFAGMVGATQTKPGVHVGSIAVSASDTQTAAQTAGLQPGDTFVAVGGEPTFNFTQFSQVMAHHHRNDVVDLAMEDGSTRTVRLGSFWETLSDAEKRAVNDATPEGNATCDARKVASHGNDCAGVLNDAAFLGIGGYDADGTQLHLLSHPFSPVCSGGGVLHWTACHAQGVLEAVQLPASEVLAERPVLSTYLPKFQETPFAASIYWPLVLIVFWVFWINLMVGLTNILPMIPLDGGHIFRDAVGGVVAKLWPRMDTDARDRVVRRTAATMSFIILGAFLLTLIGPHVLPR